MNVEEIIRQARVNFGETDPLTITDDAIIDWINTSLDTVYGLLPQGELIPELSETYPLSLTDGSGELPEDLDVLLSVRVDGSYAMEVSKEAIDRIDHNPFLAPLGPVFYTDGRDLVVREDAGTVPSSVDLSIIRPPSHVTETTDEPALAKWHPAIVLLVTARAYGQEEDQRQAMHYRNEALALLGRGNPETPEQESLEEAM